MVHVDMCPCMRMCMHVCVFLYTNFDKEYRYISLT